MNETQSAPSTYAREGRVVGALLCSYERAARLPHGDGRAQRGRVGVGGAARRAAGTRRRGALHLQTTSPRRRPTDRPQQPQLDSKTRTRARCGLIETEKGGQKKKRNLIVESGI